MSCSSRCERAVHKPYIHLPVTYWPETGEDHNVAFQIVEDGSHTWIHRDYTEWAAVLFLTPNAPRDSGTCFYRHVPSGIEWMDPVEDWELEEAMILEKLPLVCGKLLALTSLASTRAHVSA